MSITYTNTRYEPDGRLCHAYDPKEVSPGNAVIKLVRYELGYGGRIREITRTKVVVLTTMMARYDIVEFEGTEEAMLPLMVAISAWAQGKRAKGQKHIANTVEMMMRNDLNKPIHATMMTSIMFSGWVDPILCATAGLDESEAEALLERVKVETNRLEELESNKPYGYRESRSSIRSGVIDPIIELLIDGGALDEALELIAA